MDPILADSAGITDPADVARTELRHRYGRETASPDTLHLEGALWVDFLSRDHWPRRIEFVLEALSGPQRRFLESADAVASPPLVRDSARWLVPFSGAPEGPYPFRILGPRVDGGGVVIVGPGAT